MAQKIDQDERRFREIVKGDIRKNIKHHISYGDMIGRKGKDLVRIPVPQIDIPTFRFGQKGQGGVGQGSPEPGTVLAPGDESAPGEAGNSPGEHILEVDITIDEIAQIMAEELELPRIQPKGSKKMEAENVRYTTISRRGPKSLRHFRRTHKEALKRLLASGTYDPRNPVIVPIPEDERFKAGKPKLTLHSNALVVYMMDVSGSMGDEQKELVRITAFWIDTWLQSQYKGIETRYIIHDAAAKLVDSHTFYHTRESGGTKISSAYALFESMIGSGGEFDPSEWNIYGFHFSDGDNWSGGDTEVCVELLKKHLLPKLNLFCYGQVRSSYGSGEFLKALDQNEELQAEENLTTDEMTGRDDIFDCIKRFLGKGK